MEANARAARGDRRSRSRSRSSWTSSAAASSAAVKKRFHTLGWTSDVAGFGAPGSTFLARERRREPPDRARAPPLPGARGPAAGRPDRHRAGARDRVRRLAPDAARGPAAARLLASDPGRPRPRGRDLRRPYARRGHEPQRQRVDLDDARDRDRVAGGAAGRADVPRGAAGGPGRGQRHRRDRRRAAGRDRRGRRPRTRHAAVQRGGQALPPDPRPRGRQRAPARPSPTGSSRCCSRS